MKKPPCKVIRVSITMPPSLKSKYSKLAHERDMSFSQLVRHALGELKSKSPPKPHK